MNLLKGRVAIVYGSSGQIGSNIAKALFEQGAKVVIHYFSNENGADRLVKKIDESKNSVMAAMGDVTDEHSLQQLVEKTKNRFGSVDIVINTVHAPFSPSKVRQMSYDDWNIHLEALKGQFLICKTVLPVMREQKFGRIIFISAALAVRYGIGCSAYTTIKRGLNGFCKTLAIEEAKNNITVNIIAPGKVNDCNNDSGEQWDEIEKELISHCALGRFASSQEVSNTVTYLTSPMANAITGQTIYVSGGEIMR